MEKWNLLEKVRLIEHISDVEDTENDIDKPHYYYRKEDVDELLNRIIELFGE